MKKVWMCTLVLVMSLGLVACGSNEESATKEIVIWNAGIQSTDDSNTIKKEDLPLMKAIAQFEKDNKDVKVTLVDYSMDDLQKAFTAANLAESGPDLVALWAGSATQGYQDYLIDFNEFLSSDEKTEFGNSSLLFANNDLNDQLLGLPTGMPSTFVMYYNKEIFDKYKLEVPTNFEELTQVSIQLQKEGVTPMSLGDKDGYMSTWAVSNLIGNLLGPGDLSNLQSGKELMSGENFQSSLEAWKNYVSGGYTNPDFLTLNDGDAIKQFLQGNSAMIIHGNWASRDFAPMKDKVGVTMIPAISADAEFAAYMPSQPNINLVIPKYSKVKKEAVELAKVFASQKFNEDSNNAFYSDETAKRLVTSIQDLVNENKTFPGFDSLITGEAASEFYKLVPTYIKGNLDVKSFTEKLDKLNK